MIEKTTTIPRQHLIDLLDLKRAEAIAELSQRLGSKPTVRDNFLSSVNNLSKDVNRLILDFPREITNKQQLEKLCNKIKESVKKMVAEIKAKDKGGGRGVGNNIAVIKARFREAGETLNNEFNLPKEVFESNVDTPRDLFFGELRQFFQGNVPEESMFLKEIVEKLHHLVLVVAELFLSGIREENVFGNELNISSTQVQDIKNVFENFLDFLRIQISEDVIQDSDLTFDSFRSKIKEKLLHFTNSQQAKSLQSLPNECADIFQRTVIREISSALDSEASISSLWVSFGFEHIDLNSEAIFEELASEKMEVVHKEISTDKIPFEKVELARLDELIRESEWETDLAVSILNEEFHGGFGVRKSGDIETFLTNRTFSKDIDKDMKNGNRIGNESLSRSVSLEELKAEEKEELSNIPDMGGVTGTLHVYSDGKRSFISDDKKIVFFDGKFAHSRQERRSMMATINKKKKSDDGLSTQKEEQVFEEIQELFQGTGATVEKITKQGDNLPIPSNYDNQPPLPLNFQFDEKNHEANILFSIKYNGDNGESKILSIGKDKKTYGDMPCSRPERRRVKAIMEKEIKRRGLLSKKLKKAIELKSAQEKEQNSNPSGNTQSAEEEKQTDASRNKQVEDETEETIVSKPAPTITVDTQLKTAIEGLAAVQELLQIPHIQASIQMLDGFVQMLKERYVFRNPDPVVIQEMIDESHSLLSKIKPIKTEILDVFRNLSNEEKEISRIIRKKEWINTSNKEKLIQWKQQLEMYLDDLNTRDELLIKLEEWKSVVEIISKKCNDMYSKIETADSYFERLQREGVYGVSVESLLVGDNAMLIQKDHHPLRLLDQLEVVLNDYDVIQKDISDGKRNLTPGIKEKAKTNSKRISDRLEELDKGPEDTYLIEREGENIELTLFEFQIIYVLTQWKSSLYHGRGKERLAKTICKTFSDAACDPTVLEQVLKKMSLKTAGKNKLSDLPDAELLEESDDLLIMWGKGATRVFIPTQKARDAVDILSVTEDDVKPKFMFDPPSAEKIKEFDKEANLEIREERKLKRSLESKK